MTTVVSQADVAELVYAHDSGSCEHCARAGSSPAICMKDGIYFHPFLLLFIAFYSFYFLSNTYSFH